MLVLFVYFFVLLFSTNLALSFFIITCHSFFIFFIIYCTSLFFVASFGMIWSVHQNSVPVILSNVLFSLSLFLVNSSLLFLYLSFLLVYFISSGIFFKMFKISSFRFLITVLPLPKW